MRNKTNLKARKGSAIYRPQTQLQMQMKFTGNPYLNGLFDRLYSAQNERAVLTNINTTRGGLTLLLAAWACEVERKPEK